MAVRVFLRQHAPKEWPEFQAILNSTVEHELGPLSILPLAACGAAGGHLRDAVGATAAWEAASVALRMLDNTQDGDRTGTLSEAIGWQRAVNFSTAFSVWIFELLQYSDGPASRLKRVSGEFSKAGLQLLKGQDDDLRNPIRTIEQVYALMANKNGAAFALACAAGAQSADADAEDLRALRAYGTHLGIALQMLEDIEDIWRPTGLSDLQRGKISFPVVHALETAHARQKELKSIVEAGKLAESAELVMEILRTAESKEFVLYAALQERQRALDFLGYLPVSGARATLEMYLETVFSEFDVLREL